jgi:hypothetical protein
MNVIARAAPAADAPVTVTVLVPRFPAGPLIRPVGEIVRPVGDLEAACDGAADDGGAGSAAVERQVGATASGGRSCLRRGRQDRGGYQKHGAE